MTGIGDAVVAAVVAAVPGRQVSDAQVLSSPDPSGHVVVFCPEGDRQLSTLGASDARDVVVRVQSFGPNRTAARWLSVKVADYLMANGVTASGWGHAEVEEHFSHSPESDDDVREFPVVMLYDEFHLFFAKDS